MLYLLNLNVLNGISLYIIYDTMALDWPQTVSLLYIDNLRIHYFLHIIMFMYMYNMNQFEINHLLIQTL